MKHSVIMGGILIGLGIHCGSAFAAGLEKTVPWSGRYAGVAGAAASSVSGSESLYFNPAGMADSTHLDTSLNFSPVFPQFTSPLPVPNTSVNSSRAFVPEFGVFVKYSPLEHLAFGVGAYASGGSKAIYQNVDFTGLSPALAAFKPTIEADLNLIEYSLGAAYEILDGLRVGASWRVLQAFGTVGTVSNVPTTVFTDLLFNNLTDVQWNGFRFGVQYFPKDSRWGLGAFYRTQVTFTASGTTGGTVFVPATQTSTPIPSSGTSLSAVFPHQFGVGGHFDAIPKTWRLALQYEFDQYQVDQQIVTTGSVGASPIPNLTLGWNNLNVIRFGTEFRLYERWALRAGYALTGEVTPAGLASPIFSSPALGHTVAIGAGLTILTGLEANVALETSFASGSADTSSGLTTAGTYSSNDVSVHLGAGYHF